MVQYYFCFISPDREVYAQFFFDSCQRAINFNSFEFSLDFVSCNSWHVFIKKNFGESCWFSWSWSINRNYVPSMNPFGIALNIQVCYHIFSCFCFWFTCATQTKIYKTMQFNWCNENTISSFGQNHFWNRNNHKMLWLFFIRK